MNSIFVPSATGAAAATQMVWLPGAYHAAGDFLAAGFAQAVGRRRLALDLTFVDLELEHLGDRSTLERLHSDIVAPARESGVSVWLGGISLGGMLALDYAATHPGELAGVCLLAPYLGNRMLTAEIARARLADWQPGELAETDEERRIWRHLKTRRADSEPLYLGFGLDDRFAAAQGLLAASLPAAAVDAIPGGHDWGTWTTLWENFLDSRFK
jgi:pimeloyl-ACP methyl ester carboxylesterase